MAITCPRCGAGYDVTLFQFEHRVQCDCGAWVELAEGHVLRHEIRMSGHSSRSFTGDPSQAVLGPAFTPRSYTHLRDKSR